MRPSVLVRCLVALLVAPAAPLEAQTALDVVLPGGTVRSLSLAELQALPSDTASGMDHGRRRVFRGVPLQALLAAAGLAPVDSLRGAALARSVVVEGADGYRVVFSSGELDRSLGALRVLVALAAADGPLGEAEGPVRLVVPGDGRPARWVRQLRRVTVTAP